MEFIIFSGFVFKVSIVQRAIKRRNIGHKRRGIYSRKYWPITWRLIWLQGSPWLGSKIWL